jgi:hypothetical protein
MISPRQVEEGKEAVRAFSALVHSKVPDALIETVGRLFGPGTYDDFGPLWPWCLFGIVAVGRRLSDCPQIGCALPSGGARSLYAALGFISVSLKRHTSLMQWE